MKPYWVATILSGLVFATLFLFRAGVFERLFVPTVQDRSPGSIALVERDTWMNIIQKGRKIGFSHTIVSRKDAGYHIQERLFMRLNLMGLVQDVNLQTQGDLNADLSMSSFRFNMNSGRFSFKASGTVSGRTLSIQFENEGDNRRHDIQLREQPYLSAGLFDAVIAQGLTPGDVRTFSIFDLATLSQTPLVIRVAGKERIVNMGTEKDATKVSVSFKGVKQSAWISENGEVLREEGFLGIRLEKAGKHEAVGGMPVVAGQDLAQVVSVASNVEIKDPSNLQKIRIRLGGILVDDLKIEGGRQSLDGNILTITRETIPAGLPEFPGGGAEDPSVGAFLEPSPFVQSDHESIKNLTSQIVSETEHPVEKVKKLVDWVYANIEKRPVVSLPDAVSTLKNRAGDCNEHAVLLAALSRAASIPAKIETGLVYLKGRFYYHAWNLVYVGTWVTVDALFGQIPADVTHIRFTSGNQQEQLDLIGLIGKVRLEVIESFQP